MIITLKYFGILQDYTKILEEKVEFSSSSVGEMSIKDWFQNRYGTTIENNIQFALNKTIVENFSINEDAELALLPPFAGG